VLENDLAFDLAGIARVGLFRDDRVRFENRLDALETDRGLRDDVGHFRQVLHGLEELVEIGKEDRERADGHASFKIKLAPRQSTKAMQHATVTETIGESIDFTRRALSDAFTVCGLLP
jgi:hypothetical protein